jgi:hypothetical protein
MMTRSDVLGSNVQLSLTLDKYQELMRIPLAEFNGLNKPGDPVTHACTAIWKQRDRDILARYINMAEEMRENEINNFLSKKYVGNKLYDYGFPLILNKGFIDQIGTQNTSTIELEHEIDYTVQTGDDITLTLSTNVTDIDEVKVYYDGEDVEIYPTSISIYGGNLTIVIPRARLVKPSLMDDREDALAYSENDNFVAQVDIKRAYYVESTAAEFVWLDSESGDELTQAARPIIVDDDLGIIECYPATYASGWTLQNFLYCDEPWKIRLDFVSGLMSERSNILTARLAHTLMPFSPQDCEAVRQYWQKVNELHPSKVTTPYGTAYGAVEAWVFDSRFKSGGGGMFK